MQLTASKGWIEIAPGGATAALQLVCFHHAGGTASAYRGWAGILPPGIGIAAVQLPGRQKRLAEAPFTRFDLLLPALAAALGPQLRPLFALFGHSLGALLAFELCRHLRRNGGPQPLHLFLSGCNAADCLAPSSPAASQSDDALRALLHSYRGTPDGVLLDEALLELVLPTLRADLALADSYVHVPETPLDCPSTVMGGLDDPTTTPDGLAAWAGQTRSRFACRLFPGGHFFLQGSVKEMLAYLTADLTRSQALAVGRSP